MATLDIKVPDIGDFKDIPVIELLVKPGDTVKKEDSLVTLESDKATMDVPSTHGGTVKELKVKLGDKVSQGTVIAVLEVASEAAAVAPAAAQPTPAKQAEPSAPAKQAAPSAQPPGTMRQALTSTLASLDSDLHAEVLVLGSGPGGYTAAFRAADLGKKVVLVERYASLGGVCLNVGCIPSKALLHAAKVITEADEMSHLGVAFGAPKTDLDKLRGWKDSVVAKLTKGLAGLSKARKVTVVQGIGQFLSPQTLQVEGKEGRKVISFDHAAGRGQGRPQGHFVRPLHHRGGIAVGQDSRVPVRRPEAHGLHRCARAEGRAQAPARHRRRHHRPRDGDGVRRARQQGDGRRVHGPPHSRRGSGHREAAREAHREALREDHARDQGREARGHEGRPARDIRGSEGRRRPRAGNI
jgi:hypothetical protein